MQLLLFVILVLPQVVIFASSTKLGFCITVSGYRMETSEGFKFIETPTKMNWFYTLEQFLVTLHEIQKSSNTLQYVLQMLFNLFQDPTLRNKQPIPAAYNRYDQERFKGKEGKLIAMLFLKKNKRKNPNWQVIKFILGDISLLLFHKPMKRLKKRCNYASGQLSKY